MEAARLEAMVEELDFREWLKPVREGDGDRPAALCWVQDSTETFDHHWRDKGLATPYQKFPRLPFLPWLFRLFETEHRLFVAKSREMLASWSVMAWGVWNCQMFERTQVIVQTQKEEKGIELVQGREVPGYARTLYERQSECMKLEFPLKAPLDKQPANLMAWRNDSEIIAIPKGQDQIRLYHPTIVIFDEAAHLEEFQGSYGAAEPVSKQIIAVSSVAPGWFWDQVHPDGKTEGG